VLLGLSKNAGGWQCIQRLQLIFGHSVAILNDTR